MDGEALRAAEARVWDRVGVAPTEHHVRLPTLGVTVRVQEVGRGEPVLFVHGTSVSGTSWADLAARLTGFRCLLLDRPGCGLSEALPQARDLDTWLDAADRLVPDVLDALHVDTASVVATSLGGLFAVRSTAAAPERVRRLLLFAWSAGTPEAPAPVSLRVGAIPGMAALMRSVPSTPRAVRSMLRFAGLRRAIDEGNLAADAIDSLVALHRHTDTLRNESRDARLLLSVRHGWHPRLAFEPDRLARITVPTRIVHGDEDPFGSVEAARSLVADLPDAELHVLEQAGHAPWLDAPDRAVELAEEFLAAV